MLLSHQNAIFLFILLIYDRFAWRPDNHMGLRMKPSQDGHMADKDWLNYLIFTRFILDERQEAQILKFNAPPLHT